MAFEKAASHRGSGNWSRPWGVGRASAFALVLALTLGCAFVFILTFGILDVGPAPWKVSSEKGFSPEPIPPTVIQVPMWSTTKVAITTFVREKWEIILAAAIFIAIAITLTIVIVFIVNKPLHETDNVVIPIEEPIIEYEIEKTGSRLWMYMALIAFAVIFLVTAVYFSKSRHFKSSHFPVLDLTTWNSFFDDNGKLKVDEETVLSAIRSAKSIQLDVNWEFWLRVLKVRDWNAINRDFKATSADLKKHFDLKKSKEPKEQIGQIDLDLNRSGFGEHDTFREQQCLKDIIWAFLADVEADKKEADKKEADKKGADKKEADKKGADKKEAEEEKTGEEKKEEGPYTQGYNIIGAICILTMIGSHEEKRLDRLKKYEHLVYIVFSELLRLHIGVAYKNNFAGLKGPSEVCMQVLLKTDPDLHNDISDYLIAVGGPLQKANPWSVGKEIPRAFIVWLRDSIVGNRGRNPRDYISELASLWSFFLSFPQPMDAVSCMVAAMLIEIKDFIDLKSENPAPGVILTVFDKKYDWPWNKLKETCVQMYDEYSSAFGSLGCDPDYTFGT